MAGDWKAGMKRAMIDALIKLGSPVAKDASFYGWIDYDWRAAVGNRPHPKRLLIAEHGIDYAATTYEESYWDEFMGTFYEGDTRVYGVDLDLALLDGTRLKWRYAGNLSELMTEILRDGS